MNAAPPPARQIAIVEDDPEIRDLVASFLSGEGYAVRAFGDGAQFDAANADGLFDLVILDVMMPGEDGLSICRRLVRDGGPAVIIVSARGDDLDRIIGLEIGADDYLTKPFNPRELSARVKSVLRRQMRGAAPSGATSDPADADREILVFAGWRLDVDGRHLCDPDGRSVVLSPGEFSMLVAFLRRPRRVVSRDQLMDWTRGADTATVDRAIDVQLSRLRRKLRDNPKDPALIKTVRGDGYLFAADVRRGSA
ncbi:MAG: response regulator [Pseudomonadota bacterium]